MASSIGSPDPAQELIKNLVFYMGNPQVDREKKIKKLIADLVKQIDPIEGDASNELLARVSIEVCPKIQKLVSEHFDDTSGVNTTLQNFSEGVLERACVRFLNGQFTEADTTLIRYLIEHSPKTSPMFYLDGRTFVDKLPVQTRKDLLIFLIQKNPEFFIAEYRDIKSRLHPDTVCDILNKASKDTLEKIRMIDPEFVEQSKCYAIFRKWA